MTWWELEPWPEPVRWHLEDPVYMLVGRGITDHPIFFMPFAVPPGSPLHCELAAAKLMLRHRQAGENAPPFTDRHRYNVILEPGADFNQSRFIDPDILEQHRRDTGPAMLCEIVFLFDAPLLDENSVTQAGPSFVKPAVTMQEAPITEAEWTEISGLTTQS